jgi:hypothetical protein
VTFAAARYTSGGMGSGATAVQLEVQLEAAALIFSLRLSGLMSVQTSWM